MNRKNVLIHKMKTHSENSIEEEIMGDLTEVIKKSKFIWYKTKCKKVEDVNNYMADLYQIEIEGNTFNGTKKLNLFIKRVKKFPSNAVVNVQDMISRELFTYEKFAEIITELQQNYHIPKPEQFQFVRYYTGNENSLVMENMEAQNFDVFERMAVIPIEYAKESIKVLAKYHSFTFVIKKHLPDFYNNEISNKKNIFSFNKTYYTYIKTYIDGASEVLNDDESVTKLRVFGEKILDKLNFYHNDSNSRINVLCHGDYRVNNILMKHKSGESYKLVPIDFQHVHFGHPLNDLFYFIFGATDKDFRKKYLSELKEYYFDSLKTFLNLFQIEIKDVYPKDVFQKDFDERLDFGLICGLQSLPFILASNDRKPDVSKIICIPRNDEYKQRVNDLVDDFKKWGYL